MKKILLTALVAVSALAANAQVWVGGSLGYQHQDVDGADATKLNTFTIAPEVGYSLSDKVDLALQISFRSEKVGKADASTNFQVNPYVRYTFFQTGAVGFFVDGGFQITTSNADGAKAEFGIGLRPGIKFAASDKVTFVARMGYLGYVMNRSEFNGARFTDKAKTYGLGLDNAISFGLYYNF